MVTLSFSDLKPKKRQYLKQIAICLSSQILLLHNLCSVGFEANQYLKQMYFSITLNVLSFRFEADTTTVFEAYVVFHSELLLKSKKNYFKLWFSCHPNFICCRIFVSSSVSELYTQVFETNNFFFRQTFSFFSIICYQFQI